MSEEEKCSTPPSNKIKLSNSTSKIFTPCRRVGLKRKSLGSPSPLHTNILKKSKPINETEKRIEFDENTLNKNISEKDEATGIRKRIADKQREIEQLKSELKNSEQHNLDEIQKLSEKWLCVCQEALTSLFSQLNSNYFNNNTMEDLIKHLGIDPDLIHYDSINQEFN